MLRGAGRAACWLLNPDALRRARHPSTRGDESPRQPSSAATPLFGPAGGVTRRRGFGDDSHWQPTSTACQHIWQPVERAKVAAVARDAVRLVDLPGREAADFTSSPS